MSGGNSLSFKSGFVSIIGRPNVGKSTLLNAITGEKIAIMSDKPQTTRNRIQAIYTTEEIQIIFVDSAAEQYPPAAVAPAIRVEIRQVLDAAAVDRSTQQPPATSRKQKDVARTRK